MKLLALLTDESATPRNRLALSALLSGLSSTAILALVNWASQEISDTQKDEVDWLLAGGFAAAALIYAVAEVFLLSRVGRDVETAIHRIRRRLLDRLRAADYERLERVGQSSLFESITQSTQTISQNAQYLAIAFRSALLGIAILFYILYISWIAFALVLATIGLGAVVYLHLGRRLQAQYQDVMRFETQLFEAVTDLLDGFKDLRMNSARSRALEEGFAETSHRTTERRIDTQVSAFDQYIFGQIAFFLLLGVVVFVVPTYSDSFSEDVVKITTAVLFMIGPVGVFIQSLGILGGAEAAAAGMLRLDSQLAEMAEPGSEGPALALPQTFEAISLRDVAYTYPPTDGEEPFRVTLGPDVTLRRGEVVFITGGNGSGKSTLIKLLTGLYTPHTGGLTVDRIRVTAYHRQAYRELMATVFSDYHLFDRLYGLETPDPAEAADLLRWFEMDSICGILGDRFETTRLSAGQRKRLALIAALLEHKPILVLDEWAADQDPQFRRKFYREILPGLKARGLTVIAVTHDDRYFDAADRRLHMAEGRLSDLGAPAGPPAPPASTTPTAPTTPTTPTAPAGAEG